jgi:hypothetical protein
MVLVILGPLMVILAVVILARAAPAVSQTKANSPAARAITVFLIAFLLSFLRHKYRLGANNGCILRRVGRRFRTQRSSQVEFLNVRRRYSHTQTKKCLALADDDGYPMDVPLIAPNPRFYIICLSHKPKVNQGTALAIFSNIGHDQLQTIALLVSFGKVVGEVLAVTGTGHKKMVGVYINSISNRAPSV